MTMNLVKSAVMSILRVVKEIKFYLVLSPGLRVAFFWRKILGKEMTHGDSNKIRNFVTTTSNMDPSQWHYREKRINNDQRSFRY